MTVSNPLQGLEETKKVPIICPICKTKKNLELPTSVVNQASNIATISLPKGLICEHHFQMFVDKNFHVRGYQKVDLEMEVKRTGEKKKNDPSFENLLFDGNFVEYRPTNPLKHERSLTKQKLRKIREEKMSDEQIYEEFWEFIDDNNVEFHDFIVKDKRRKKPQLIP